MYVINSIYFVPGSRHHQELQGLLRELARDDGDSVVGSQVSPEETNCWPGLRGLSRQHQGGLRMVSQLSFISSLSSY